MSDVADGETESGSGATLCDGRVASDDLVLNATAEGVEVVIAKGEVNLPGTRATLCEYFGKDSHAPGHGYWHTEVA